MAAKIAVILLLILSFELPQKFSQKLSLHCWVKRSYFLLVILSLHLILNLMTFL